MPGTYWGYKLGEIAKLARCTVGCSKSQVHKARKRLQRLLLGNEELTDVDDCPVEGGEAAVI
jgi:DNA-directed RNA polymerase specialized sigma24 family protein